MAWDFSTEPEFQKKLDWVEQFCREKVEPLDTAEPSDCPVDDNFEDLAVGSTSGVIGPSSSRTSCG